ncbi:MAG: hypothetical protein R3D84_12730 [Paracoccaceae bacterium]
MVLVSLSLSFVVWPRGARPVNRGRIGRGRASRNSFIHEPSVASYLKYHGQRYFRQLDKALSHGLQQRGVKARARFQPRAKRVEDAGAKPGAFRNRGQKPGSNCGSASAQVIAAFGHARADIGKSRRAGRAGIGD